MRVQEAQRHDRQWYRRIYSSSRYRTARAIRRSKARGQCERVLADGARCTHAGAEANHTIPISEAHDLAEALEFSRWELLEWVCADHNPRGRQK